MIPTWGQASPCVKFTWEHPSEMIKPDSIVQAQEAIKEGHHDKARKLFISYVEKNPEGLFSEGARYALASLPQSDGELAESFIKIIDRLTVERDRNPESVYAPWALCRIGELYRQAGWFLEAKATFEQFLEQYQDNPLAGSVMVAAGLTFFQDRKYLEAALVFRRVLENENWKSNHVDGALGLANATALGHAWKQAYYWYQVVEAEQPDLIRYSSLSSYEYGLAEMKVGDPDKAISRLLLAYNLHHDQVEAGLALNHIAAHLRSLNKDLVSLWFSQQVAGQFKDREPGRRGEAALVRWMVSQLSQEHTEEEWSALIQSLNKLEVELTVSWEEVNERAEALLEAPEPDLTDEARFWVAQSYQERGEMPLAIANYVMLVSSYHLESWGEKARTVLTEILDEKILHRYQHQNWVALINFWEEQQDAFQILLPDSSRTLMVAEAYQEVGLPDQAIRWYDESLKLHADHQIREDLMGRKVFAAGQIGDSELIKKIAREYEETYPHGQSRTEVTMLLGTLAMQESQYEQGIRYFEDSVKHTRDEQAKIEARRALAKAYWQAGNIQKAINEYHQLLEGKRAEVRDQIALADLLFESEQYRKAAELYDGLRVSASSSEIKTWAQFRLGVSYQRIGKAKESNDVFGKLRDLDQPGEDIDTTIQAAANAAMKEFVNGRTLANVQTN